MKKAKSKEITAVVKSKIGMNEGFNQFCVSKVFFGQIWIFPSFYQESFPEIFGISGNNAKCESKNVFRTNFGFSLESLFHKY